MTENGSCYKAFDFCDACCELCLGHLRTKRYTPPTRQGRTILSNGVARMDPGYTHTQIDK